MAQTVEKWTIDDLIAWARVSRSAALAMVGQPGFPLPSSDGLWSACEVFDWLSSLPPGAEVVPEPTALYRHFAADGTLLYVGISLRLLSRITQHKVNAAWFLRIARIELEWFPDFGSAQKAEEDAIKREKPLHNKVHKCP